MARRNASLILLGIVTPVLLALGCAGGGEHEHDHVHTDLPRRSVPEGAGAPLFSDLGSFHREISTRSELAQKYFDQGLVLAYGFNHAEALRSFREASTQDPSCAICAWGEAFVLGPNINKPMDDADVPAAYEAAQRAARLSASASPVEQALIAAIGKRYAAAPVADRKPLDLAYAAAMKDAAARFPDDVDVLALYAEAVMDTMPWDYYVDPQTPKPEAVAAFAALEKVLARAPDHVGALHFWIHAVEPSDSPDRAEAAADRLGPLSPGAGHLVHMPSHIYLRIGRYHDASRANELAAGADESYITQCRAQGYYPATYYPHNIHFLYASAAFEGRSAVSIAAARKLTANITPEVVAEVPIAEEFAPIELYALARFGRWDDLLAAKAPPEAWRYATGAWHFGRGMAFAATGQAAAAQAELAVVRAFAAEKALRERVFASGSRPAELLTIAGNVLEARIASEAGQWDRAVELLETAVEQQDALPYTEPPPWYFPNREALGVALLAANRPAGAENVFAEQLEHTPRNGWSLRGLADSQRAQGNAEAAAETERQLAEAWSLADVQLERATF